MRSGTMLSAMLVFGLPAWWLSETAGWVGCCPVGLVAGDGRCDRRTIWVRYG